MPFNLFHKKKQPEQETKTIPPQEDTHPQAEEPNQSPQQNLSANSPTESMSEPIETQEQPQVATAVPEEQKTEKIETQNKTYLKAMPLRDLADLKDIKTEIENGNIIILKVTPLAQKSIEDVKSAVNELYQFAETMGGDIARLGEERVVICPKSIRIWREKTPKPVANESVPTAA